MHYRAKPCPWPISSENHSERGSLSPKQFTTTPLITNLYAYVGSDPINRIDPIGTCQIAIWRGGYIVGWNPCDDPKDNENNGESGKSKSDCIDDKRPKWQGPVEIPTEIPKDPIQYPEKTLLYDWSPRDTVCFAACMGVGTAAALKAALITDQVFVGAEGLAKTTGTKVGKMIASKIPVVAPIVFGGEMAYGMSLATGVCDKACR